MDSRNQPRDLPIHHIDLRRYKLSDGFVSYQPGQGAFKCLLTERDIYTGLHFKPENFEQLLPRYQFAMYYVTVNASRPSQPEYKYIFWTESGNKTRSLKSYFITNSSPGLDVDATFRLTLVLQTKTKHAITVKVESWSLFVFFCLVWKGLAEKFIHNYELDEDVITDYCVAYQVELTNRRQQWLRENTPYYPFGT